jgi:hypothetical protein
MISGPNYKTSIGNSVWGIAGYYADYDGLQHVVVAAKDGNVYEAHWSQEVAPTVGSLGDLGTSLVDIAAFFTLDDNFHHAVGVTNDGTLHELYYNLGQAPTRRNLYHISSFDASKGAAGFYSPGDTLLHVVIVDAMGNPVDISWNGQQQPTGNRITIPPTDTQVASISSFVSVDGNACHIVVAGKDGRIYDIDYPDEAHIPQTVDQGYVRTSFNEPVKNVTAFFSADNNYRHVVVLTQSNLLRSNAYDIQGNQVSTPLPFSTLLSDVADFTSCYSAFDGLRHVIFATHGGDLYEITYTSQG